MILECGSKVLVSHRRLFESDQSRYFIGVVEGYEHGVARVSGHTWTRESYRGTVCRKNGIRTKIIALASGTVIVYQLPTGVNMEALVFEHEGTRMYLRDGGTFEMDLTEGHLQPSEARRSA